MISEFIVKHRQTIVRVFLAVLFALFSYLFLASLVKPLYQDEGVFLTIGKGIVNGKLPYLDFWDHKTPGIYYIYAGLFQLFGTRVILYKIFIWLVSFITGAFVYGISEKLKRGSGKYSIIIFLCSVVFLEGNYLGAGPFLGLFLAGAVWLLILYPKKKWAYVGSGLALACAIIMKQTAIMSILPLLIYLFLTWNLVHFLLFLVGLAAPIWLLVLYLKGNQSFSEFWAQAFGASTKSYPADPIAKVLSSLAETFTRIWWLLAGFLASFIDIKSYSKQKWLVIMMAILPTYTFFVRPYPHYWLQVLPFVSVLAGIGFLIFFEWLLVQKFNFMAIVIFVGIILSFWYSTLWFKWVTENLNQPRQNEQAWVVEKVGTLDGKLMLVENRYTGFYFLTDKEPVTKYLYLTEVNEGESARQKTMDALENGHDITILWPKDQSYVYAKEIGIWAEENCQKIAEYPALDLVIYHKD